MSVCEWSLTPADGLEAGAPRAQRICLLPLAFRHRAEALGAAVMEATAERAAGRDSGRGGRDEHGELNGSRRTWHAMRTPFEAAGLFLAFPVLLVFFPGLTRPFRSYESPSILQSDPVAPAVRVVDRRDGVLRCDRPLVPDA